MYPISVACFDHNVWIRVTGRGSFKCSGILKELVQKQAEKGYYNYILDLLHCEQMDSTFMGTITGLAQRLRQKKQGALKVTNVSESNQKLMENLGLDELFPIRPLSLGSEMPKLGDECFCDPMELVKVTEDKTATQEIVISAHQALIAADQKNIEKFKDLFEVMH